MFFASDTTAPVCSEILDAIRDSSDGFEHSYGADSHTQRLNERVSELFETSCVVYPVITGTASNALALSVLSPPYGVVLCHRTAHIQEDECAAPEFFSGGARLGLLEGENGRMTVTSLTEALSAMSHGVHSAPMSALSLSQATEWGTVYRPEHVSELAGIAKRHDLSVHMDGARFANALVSSGATPAQMTWKAGVDVLSLGATKCGALGAEAVIFFHPERAADFERRRKRAGHLISKMRFVSAQLNAWFENDLWLRLAGHANQMAQILAHSLQELPGVSIVVPVEANEIFVQMPALAVSALEKAGADFYTWTGGTSQFP